jgi:hypothetical protein
MTRNSAGAGAGGTGGGAPYTLPLAADGTRGGVQIGYTTSASAKKYAVQLDSEKMYVEVTSYPWASLSDKPATATRWPTFDEVTSKPATATRWPTFDEVTSKPATATRWPSWSEVTSKPASKTAWGQTYLNASSEFQNISGNLSSVGHISFSGDNTYDLGSSSVAMRSGYFGTSLKVNAVEIGNMNEINAVTGQTLFLQYRNDGDLSLCYNGANVGIGLTSPSYKLHVVGKIYCTGGFAFLSDIRKKNVVGFCDGFRVKDIANAPLIQYTLKGDLDDGRRHIGSVAQYWQKVLPDTVNEADDTLSMDQESILMASVITLARKVMSLENQIIQLKVKGYGK